MSASGEEAKRWFYVREGRRIGPVETQRLVDLVLSGEVSEDALVWHAGLPEWLKAQDAEEIRRELPPPVPVTRPPRPPETAVPAEPGEPTTEPATEGDSTSIPGAEGALDEGNGHRRRRKKKRRHRDARRQPAWLWPLVGVLVVLMIFLWWLLRRMNEVPQGRIIQTGSLDAQPTPEPPGTRWVSSPRAVESGRDGPRRSDAGAVLHWEITQG